MIKLFGIYWYAPNLLFFLPLIFLIIFLLFRNVKRITTLVAALTHKQHRETLLLHFSSRRYFFKGVLFSGALFFLFIAMLRPQWDKKEKTIVQEGRDVLIVLDISRSMLAQDLKPSRLNFVKFKVKALLKLLKFERVGLILFSGSAFVQCPLTSDYETFSMFLDQVEVENIASGTTAIDAALKKAVESYKHDRMRKNKLVLLITDGEDFSFDLTKVKQEAKRENIKLFALGAATPQGAPIPKFDIEGNPIGHEMDKEGNIVLSKLNETLLKEICSSLNGTYIKTTYNDTDIEQLVRIITAFEKEKFEDRKISMYDDKYPWFLGISWALLALEWIL